MKQYRNRIYNPRGQINPYGHSRPTYESKRREEPYGSKAEKYLEKTVPVEKDRQGLNLELEIEELETGELEAEVDDFSLDERDVETNLEKEAELEQKEFIEEEEDMEIGHA